MPSLKAALSRLSSLLPITRPYLQWNFAQANKLLSIDKIATSCENLVCKDYITNKKNPLRKTVRLL